VIHLGFKFKAYPGIGSEMKDEVVEEMMKSSQTANWLLKEMINLMQKLEFE
jgi:hypothetical protein